MSECFKHIRVGTRKSPLAVTQTGEAVNILRTVLPQTQFELVEAETIGDRDLTTDLASSTVPDDFFTRDLDVSQVAGDLDITIHSAKDLPAEMHPELTVAALLPARDIRDALVFGKGFDEQRTPRIIGTSSPQRIEQIRRLYPDITAKPIRGAIHARLEQLDAGKYDAVIIAACALQRLGITERIGRFLPYDPAPQQGRLAVVVKQSNQKLISILSQLDVRRNAGLVASIGCPADPSMMSDRVRSYLEAADIILHDRLIPQEILDLYADKLESVGKTGHQPSLPQSEIHYRLLQQAEKGKLVVRLHGGDPGILGHLGETLSFLADWNIRAEVVPAVSASQVAAARAKTSLTHRDAGRSITFLTGHSLDQDPNFPVPGPHQGHLAVYMGISQIATLQTRLTSAGWPLETSVIIGERLGYKDERILTTSIENMTGLHLNKPAVILVGPESYPAGSYTLFTGTDTTPFIKHGPLIHLPLIKLRNRPIDERVAHIKSDFEKWDGVVLPSRFAVKSFVEALMAFSDIRALHGKKILAVGPMTAEGLKSYGIKADATPNSFGGIEALGKELAPEIAGRYFYPCSDTAPQEKRISAVREFGIELNPQVFYENHAVHYDTLPGLHFDRVLFTSSSTVQSYFKNFPNEHQAKRTWLAVGTSTLKTIQELGHQGVVL